MSRDSLKSQDVETAGLDSAENIDGSEVLPVAGQTTHRIDCRTSHRIEEIIENISEGFVEIAFDWRYSYVNRAASRFLAKSREELIGVPMLEAFPEAKGTVFEENFRKVMERRERLQFEAYYAPLDAWYDCCCYPVPEGISVFFRDVTEQKHAKRELQESQADLNFAQAIARTGSWRFDLQQNELHWSDEHYRIFDIARGTPITFDALLGKVHPDDRSFLQTKWLSALSGESCSFEYRILAEDRIEWVYTTAVANLDGDGMVKGMFGTTQDITDHKRDLAALAEAHDRIERDLLDMGRLQEISTRLIEHGDVDQLIDALLSTAVWITRADSGSLHLLDDHACVPTLKVQHGFEGQFLDRFSQVKADMHGLYGMAFATGERVVVPDLGANEELLGTREGGILYEVGVRAMQSTPIRSREGHPLGLISTYWQEPHQPHDRELRLLDILARQTADTVDRCRAMVALRDSEDALFQLNRHLELKVRERTAVADLRALHLRHMAAELSNAEFRERERLAARLHDDLQQLLLGVKHSRTRSLAGCWGRGLYSRYDAFTPHAAITAWRSEVTD